MRSPPRAPTRMAYPDIMSRIPKSPANHDQEYQQYQEQFHRESRAERRDAPLLIALIENHEWSQAIHRLREYPDEASMTVTGSSNNAEKDEKGCTALHEACKNQPPVELVNLLLEIHEVAAQTKSHLGFLPLHFACMAGASVDTVARLLMTYPSATRSKEEQEGQLPLHIAAKWGAGEDVLLALLMVHPKASVIRDASGRTPLELAKVLSSSHAREDAFSALRQAPILMAVNKAAMNKLTYESDAKLREVVEVYQDRMNHVKDKYEEDQTHTVALEAQLRKELWEEKERSSQLEEQVQLLTLALEENQHELEQKDDILQQIQSLMSKTMLQTATTAMRQPSQSLRDIVPIANISEGSKNQAMPPRANDTPHDGHIETAKTARSKQNRLAKLAFQEWSTSPQNSVKLTRLSAETEERDPPPPQEKTSQEHRRHRGQKQHDPERYPEPIATKPSPKSAAVATVKEWFSSESEDSEESSPDMIAKAQPDQKLSCQSLLVRSKRSGLASSAILASRAAAERSRSQSQSSSRYRPTSPRDTLRRKNESSVATPSTTPSTSFSNSSRMAPTTDHIGLSVLSSKTRHTRGNSPGRPRRESAGNLPTSYNLPPRNFQHQHNLSKRLDMNNCDEEDEDPTIVSRAEWE